MQSPLRYPSCKGVVSPSSFCSDGLSAAPLERRAGGFFVLFPIRFHNMCEQNRNIVLLLGLTVNGIKYTFLVKVRK